MTFNVFGLKIRCIEKEIMEETGFAGYFDPKNNLIVVDSTQSDKDKIHTYLHELGHAMAYRLGWKQTLPQQLEETMVEQIATLIVENFEIGFKNDSSKVRTRRNGRTAQAAGKPKESK